MNSKISSSKVALCGVVTALCVATMFASGLIPVFTYTLPALCGFIIMLISMAVGNSAGWLVFVATSLFAFLLTPDKECAIMFVAFFGYYPMLKFSIEKIRNKFLKHGAKLVIFNVAIIVSQIIVIKVIGIPFETNEFLGKWIVLVLLVLANILFVAYDVALTQIKKLYVVKWKKLFNKFIK